MTTNSDNKQNVNEISYAEYGFCLAPKPILLKYIPDFVADLGFEPHKDYRKASRVFGDIDPDECTTEFEYGHDGKPFFISGPHDSPAKCKRIMDTLTKRVGPDGFEFILGGPGFDISG